MDCALALTLLKSVPVYKKHKVKKIVYSSLYRPSRSHRPSRHALGLAIDVRDVVFADGTSLNVKKHWRRAYGRPDNCVGRFTTAESVQLRRIVCDLEEANTFRRILTPDSDPAHSDHFHMAAGKPKEKWRRTRWAGRLLYQPLPKTRLFRSWYRWYRCYKYRSRRSRSRCYRARSPRWVRSGNPYKFYTWRRQRYLGRALAARAHRPGKKRPKKSVNRSKAPTKEKKKSHPRSHKKPSRRQSQKGHKETRAPTSQTERTAKATHKARKSKDKAPKQTDKEKKQPANPTNHSPNRTQIAPSRPSQSRATSFRQKSRY
jgi:hypothetical protein